jgi:hypothetical protein
LHDLEPALCPVPNAREAGRATFDFQKLVESGTSRLRNVFLKQVLSGLDWLNAAA